MEFKTTNLALAAYLRYTNTPLDAITKEHKLGTFYFVEVKEEDLRIFNLGQALVEPLHYNQLIKALTLAVKNTEVL